MEAHGQCGNEKENLKRRVLGEGEKSSQATNAKEEDIEKVNDVIRVDGEEEACIEHQELNV
uniref:Uncharacterized protein n=1 Tax=Cucumis melo TaxID=3656 RepID=A0A9I9EKC0_CUCME